MKCLRALIGAHALLAFKIKERSNGAKFSGTTTSASPVLASSVSSGLPVLPTLLRRGSQKAILREQRICAVAMATASPRLGSLLST